MNENLSANEMTPKERGDLMDRILNGTTDHDMRQRHSDWNTLTAEQQESLRAQRVAEHEAERDAYLKEVQRKSLILQAEHQRLKEAYADQPLVLAVLQLHAPTTEGMPECAHCAELALDVGGTDQLWPCATFQKMREAHEAAIAAGEGDHP